MMRGNAPEPHATWPPTMHYVRRGMRVLAEPTKDQGHLRVGWQGGAEQLDCRLGKLHWRRRTVARSKRGVHAQRSPCRPPKMLQCFRITSTGETIDKRLEVRGWSEFFFGGGCGTLRIQARAVHVCACSVQQFVSHLQPFPHLIASQQTIIGLFAAKDSIASLKKVSRLVGCFVFPQEKFSQ